MTWTVWHRCGVPAEGRQHTQRTSKLERNAQERVYVIGADRRQLRSGAGRVGLPVRSLYRDFRSNITHPRAPSSDRRSRSTPYNSDDTCHVSGVCFGMGYLAMYDAGWDASILTLQR